MINQLKGLFLVALISVYLFAETSVVTTPATAVSSPIIGELDVRPTVEYQKEADTATYLDSTATLGYKFTPQIDLSYLQEVMVNFHQLGNDAKLGFSYLRFNYADLLKDNSGNSLRWQARAYLPANSNDAREGMVTEIRNYLWYTHEFSPSYKLSLGEAPIFNVTHKPGFIDAKGEEVANNFFTNRFIIEQSVTLTSNLTLTFPILIDNSKSQNFGTKGSSWSHLIWIYPDVTYNLNKNLSLGLAWRNDYDGFVSSDFKRVTFKEAFEKGAFEMFLTASL